tara:strand:- start:687 stop:1106 length:420 start_codon:yes stop_codon:yes gene_type:complete
LFELCYSKKDSSEKPNEPKVFKETEKPEESEESDSSEELKEPKGFKETEKPEESEESDSTENPDSTEVVNINSTIDIKRNAFSKENLNYMNTENNSEYDFIVKCIKENFKGIINYIREVFFNKNQISNNTICKKKKKIL